VRSADPRLIVARVLNSPELDALPDYVREDYLSSYEGDRFVESMRYVRTYPTELPALADLLSRIQTPVQIIAGARDRVVPSVNAEFLHERLAKSRLEILDAGHYTWEDAADEYAAVVSSWWSGGYSKLDRVLDVRLLLVKRRPINRGDVPNAARIPWPRGRHCGGWAWSTW
jgi:pimeloyl-ACP methyl ester carboxylesterase